MGKAPLGGGKTGSNSTDRGKRGAERSVLTNGRGVPISVAMAGANIHDHLLMRRDPGGAPIDRPEPIKADPEHLRLDEGEQTLPG